MSALSSIHRTAKSGNHRVLPPGNVLGSLYDIDACFLGIQASRIECSESMAPKSCNLHISRHILHPPILKLNGPPTGSLLSQIPRQSPIARDSIVQDPMIIMATRLIVFGIFQVSHIDDGADYFASA